MKIINKALKGVKSLFAKIEENLTEATTIPGDWQSAHPVIGITPDKLERIFKEAERGDIRKQMDLYDDITERDPSLEGLLTSRKLAVTGLEWDVKPAEEEKQAKKIAEQTKAMLLAIPNFEQGLMALLDAIGKGVSAVEINWHINSKTDSIAVKELIPVPSRRLTFWGEERPENHAKLLTKNAPLQGEEMQKGKFAVFYHSLRNSHPARGGVLRTASRLWLLKAYTLRYWGLKNELYAIPFRLGTYRNGATEHEIKTLKRAVKGLASDSGAVISEGTTISLLEATRTGGDKAFKELADYVDGSIAKLILGHSAAASSTPGKLGNETGAKEVRQDFLEYDATALMSCVTNSIIKPWVEWMFGEGVAIPQFCLKYEKEEDKEKQAKIYKTLTESGLQMPAGWVREQFGIPDPKEGEETIGGMPTAPLQDTSVANTLFANKAHNIQKETFTPEQQEVENFLERLAQKGADNAEDENSMLFNKAITEGKSYSDVLETLQKIAPNLKSEKIQRLMEAGFINAVAYGQEIAKKNQQGS